MRSEPLYQFVRGKGWQLASVPTVQTSDGLTLQIIERQPVKGEKYVCGNVNNQGTREGSFDNYRLFVLEPV